MLRFLMPSISPKTIERVHWALRKLAHVTEYLILGLLLFRAFRDDSKELRILRLGIFFLTVLVLYAASDEFHQTVVHARTASLDDVIIDILGSIIGLGLSVSRQLSRLHRR